MPHVQVDRSEVKSVGCVSDDQEFATKFGIPNTKANCELMNDHWLYPNCSLAVYYGIQTGESFPWPLIAGYS